MKGIGCSSIALWAFEATLGLVNWYRDIWSDRTPSGSLSIRNLSPAGVISTAQDTHGRPTVIELVPARGLRLYPVGRLDADSSGLIVLTNDGELANRLTHPSFEVPRTYMARVTGGPVGRAALSTLRGGVDLDDGPTAPARVRRLSESFIELTIHEGRNRQVRRMCEAVGHPVLELRRTGFGPLRLDGLKPGAHRRLSAAEVERLRAL